VRLTLAEPCGTSTDGIGVTPSVSRHKPGAESARVASLKDALRWNDHSHLTRGVPPVPAGIVERFAEFRERSIPLLRTDIKILRTDTQHHCTFVSKHSVLDAPYRDDGTDLNVGVEPVLNRLLGLVPARGIGIGMVML